MRVTRNMLDRGLVERMNQGMEELKKLNEQLTSGHKINTVSDDVAGSAWVMQLKKEKSSYSIYRRNIQTVKGVYSNASSTLQSVSQNLKRAKELGVQAATESYSAADRQGLAKEIDGLLRTCVTDANLKVNGSYIFSGQTDQVKPYETTTAGGKVTDVTYQGSRINTEVQIAPARRGQTNLVGHEIYQTNTDMFQSLIDLRDAMNANDTGAIQDQVAELEAAHQDITISISEMGGRINDVEALDTVMEDFSLINDEQISRWYDADYGEVTSRYQQQMSALQAVMKVATRAVPPTLADFI